MMEKRERNPVNIFLVLVICFLAVFICLQISNKQVTDKLDENYTQYLAEYKQGLEEDKKMREESVLMFEQDKKLQKEAIEMAEEFKKLNKMDRENVERYSQILDTWEKQQEQYQKYLDSLSKK